jgi:hypothetical protein
MGSTSRTGGGGRLTRSRWAALRRVRRGGGDAGPVHARHALQARRGLQRRRLRLRLIPTPVAANRLRLTSVAASVPPRPTGPSLPRPGPWRRPGRALGRGLHVRRPGASCGRSGGAAPRPEAPLRGVCTESGSMSRGAACLPACACVCLPACACLCAPARACARLLVGTRVARRDRHTLLPVGLPCRHSPLSAPCLHPPACALRAL